MLNENINSFILLMNSLIRTICSKYNLSISQYYTLQSIPSSGLSMTELSVLLGIDNSTLTRNINVLIKVGLVIKEQSQFDKREYISLLSNNGYLLLDKVDKEINISFDEISSSITQQDKNHLNNIIEKINWKLNCKINDI